MRFIVMTVGYIHSGKTTFGRKLASLVPHTVCLERDPVAAMLNENFPAVLEEDKKTWDLKNGQRLKDRIFNIILQEAKDNPDLHLVLTNCNARREDRTKQIAALRAEMKEAKIIMVYFDIDIQEIERRVQFSEKPKTVLTVSSDFVESLQKQKTFFQKPAEDEADLFFTIRNNENTDEVLAAISELLLSAASN